MCFQQLRFRLDNNYIRNVTIFPKLAIRILNLRENKIDTIARYAFRDLAHLEVLDLSNNWLTFDSLRPEVFEGNYDPVNYEPLKSLKVNIVSTCISINFDLLLY